MPVFQYSDDFLQNASASLHPGPLVPSISDNKTKGPFENVTKTIEGKESPPNEPMVNNVPNPHTGRENSGNGGPLCTDRAELIERIKRGESPTWVPNPTLREEYIKANGEPVRRSPPRDLKPRPAPLLPSAEVQNIARNEQVQEQLHSPFDIQRPRSALHAGDFTEESQKSTYKPRETLHTDGSEPRPDSNASLGCSPTTPWYRSNPSLGTWEARAPWALYGDSSNRQPPRDRAPSLGSFSSSSYVLRAPTTPLVQQSNNADLDFAPRDRSASPDKGNRRHTLPPHALHDWHAASTSEHPASSPSRYSISYRREASFPHGHHDRRSITSNWSLQHPSSPPTPAFLRSRRTSFSSEVSPRQRASMVGSYEESILRGRMSTAPSKPFDFTAHIGALGKGKKPKMPAHVTVPFHAVFYDWSSANSGKNSNDEPSPYVGHIDLQNAERPADDKPLEASTSATTGNANNIIIGSESPTTVVEKHLKRKRSGPKIVPPNGSYRIPEAGQIQVVVKNPYKTALKLFLVPYDLKGMEAGQKTFVRQRYYSAGPVIEKPLASDKLPLHTSLQCPKKPTLRYLIHLNICSPTKGRFYLYQHIRVVFANRVPDDKEYLTKEVQEPKPKYSPWKPVMDTIPSSTTGARLAAEKAIRRRSSGFSYSDHTANSRRVQSYTGSSYPYADTEAPPVPPIPFRLPPPKHPYPQGLDDQKGDVMYMEDSRPTTSSDLASPLSEKLALRRGHSSSLSGEDDYTKLRKGDAGYGGVFGRPGTPEPGEGLLARRLRGLGMQKDFQLDNDE